MTEYNVSESDGIVEIGLEANGTSEFDYFVHLDIGDINTGENIPLFTCIIRSYSNVFKHTCVCTNILYIHMSVSAKYNDSSRIVHA